MKALVINLDSATQRMAFQKKQLESLEISFQRLPTYKINSSKEQFYQRYCSTWQRPMSTSEVSCFFSHKNAWDQVVKENQPMLILEDDALLAQNVPCILKELSHLKNMDYVNLEERKTRKKLLAKTSKNQFCNASLIRLYQGRSGAAGYVLWPSGAEKLLKQINKGIGIADKFINENYSLNAYQIEPAPIIQLDQCKAYQIEPPFEVKSSICSNTERLVSNSRWNFKLRRILGVLKIALNQILHSHHANRRPVEISDQFKKHS